MRFYYGQTLAPRHADGGRTHIGVSTGLLGFTGAWWGAILAYWLIGMVILAVLVPALAIALVLRAGGWLTERPWPRIGRALNMGAGALFGVALIAGQLLERI